MQGAYPYLGRAGCPHQVPGHRPGASQGVSRVVPGDERASDRLPAGQCHVELELDPVVQLSRLAAAALSRGDAAADLVVCFLAQRLVEGPVVALDHDGKI